MQIEGRKNRRGRIPKFDGNAIVFLRDNKNYSYTEIAQSLGMKSRQLARYYYLNYKNKIK
jgi:transcriptional regulator with XRE-family HTH domain